MKKKSNLFKAILILALCWLAVIYISGLQYNHKISPYDQNNFSMKTSSIEMDISVLNADASFVGESRFIYSAQSLATGDVNGDGYDDIIIGAPEYDDKSGKTYLIFGKPSGWINNVNLSGADASFIGERSWDRSGYSVASCNVNNDDYDDILIGAYGYDTNRGKTYLILGKPSGWTNDVNLSTADASFVGETEGEHSGYSIASAGDINGDNYDDIVIGAPRNCEVESNAGKTYLILGKPSGWTVDVDLSNADASFTGETAWDQSGNSVACAGDVNGDNYDDIVIGARYSGDEAGKTYLVLGGPSVWSGNVGLSNANASFIGETAGDQCGLSVAGAGDVNNDTYDDILIGAFKFDNARGKTYIIMGKPSGWEVDVDLSGADASFIGEMEDDHCGRFVAGVGDVNDDDYDDFLITAHSNDEGGSEAGQVYLILGKPSGWGVDMDLSNSDASFIGEPYSYSGSSLAGGDVNGDGNDDILIGGPFFYGCEGKTYIFLDFDFPSSGDEPSISSYPLIFLIPLTSFMVLICTYYFILKNSKILKNKHKNP